MIDSEKAIKGLEEISDYFYSVYRHSEDREEINKAKDRCDAVEDALALLKEQEAVEPIPPTDDSDLWRCGYCNSQIFRCTHQRFCHECGREVKWE